MAQYLNKEQHPGRCYTRLPALSHLFHTTSPDSAGPPAFHHHSEASAASFSVFVASKSVLYPQLTVLLLLSSLRFENCPLSKSSPRKGSYSFKGATLVFTPVEQFYLLQNSHHVSPLLSHHKDIVFFKDPLSENQLVNNKIIPGLSVLSSMK